MATGNHLRHLKKKKFTRDQRLLCVIQKEKVDIPRFYCCFYFFLIGSDLGVINCDKTDEVGAESSDSLKFGALDLY